MKTDPELRKDLADLWASLRPQKYRERKYPPLRPIPESSDDRYDVDLALPDGPPLP